MPVVNNRSEWPLITQAENQKKGKLILVELQPGRFVKMYEQDAISKGLIPGKNKMIPPGSNKSAEKAAQTPKTAPETAPVKNMPEIGSESAAKNDPAPPQQAAGDDFTSIAGIGVASARALANHGVLTFDDLVAATKLDYLTPKAQQAIADWQAVRG